MDVMDTDLHNDRIQVIASLVILRNLNYYCNCRNINKKKIPIGLLIMVFH